MKSFKVLFPSGELNKRGERSVDLNKKIRNNKMSSLTASEGVLHIKTNKTLINNMLYLLKIK